MGFKYNLIGRFFFKFKTFKTTLKIHREFAFLYCNAGFSLLITKIITSVSALVSDDNFHKIVIGKLLRTAQKYNLTLLGTFYAGKLLIVAQTGNI